MSIRGLFNIHNCISFCKTWKLSEFKFFEIQLDFLTMLADEVFVFNLETRTKQDHEGVYFCLTLFRFMYLGITFYDSRHYDFNGD